MALERAEPAGLVLDHAVVLARLAEVDGQADDLGPVGVLDPLQHHAGVEPARVEQQDPLDLGGVGLVAGGRLVVQRIRGCLRSLGAHRTGSLACLREARPATALRCRRCRLLRAAASVVVGSVGVVVGSVVVVGRRFRGLRRGRLGRRRLGRFGSVESVVVSEEIARARVAAAVVAGDHDHRDHEADDHRDQAGDEQPHVARGDGDRGLRAGPSSASGPRASPYSSGPSIASRISLGVLDLEAVSQPHLDLLAAAARDRHLGGEQAGGGGAAAAAAAGFGGTTRRSRGPPARPRTRARPRASGSSSGTGRPRRARPARPGAGAPPSSSRSASSRRRSATIRSARAAPPRGSGFASFSASSMTLQRRPLGGVDDHREALGGLDSTGGWRLGAHLARSLERLEERFADQRRRPARSAPDRPSAGGSSLRVPGSGTLTIRPRSSRSAPTAAASIPVLEADAEHQPAAADLAHAVEREQAVAQRRRRARARRAAGPGRRRSRAPRAPPRRRPAPPAKVEPWSPGSSTSPASGVVRQAPIGKPPPSALARGQHVGPHRGLLVGPERAGPPHPGLDLVEDQQRPGLVAGLRGRRAAPPR